MPRYKHGSGSMRRRGKNWYISYYVEGKQFEESARTKDRAEARQLLLQRQTEIAVGSRVAAGRITFDELMRLIVTDYEIRGLASLPKLQIRIERHLRPFFRGRRAQDITSTDVQAFIAKRQGEGAANGSINRELSDPGGTSLQKAAHPPIGGAQRSARLCGAVGV